MVEEPKKKLVGRITHYFTRIGVGIVDLTDDLRVGDEILIQGRVTNFRQKVESMEIEHQKVEHAKAGDSIGLKVNERVRENDLVYKIVE